MSAPIPPLKPEQLRHPFANRDLAFDTTDDLEPCTTIIGQDRGVEAIEFGIRMRSPGYNVFVMGESGTGRTTAIQRFVEERAADTPVASDWIYVHNFQAPHKPVAISLPAGQGCAWRDAMRQLVSQLRDDIARAFDNQAFRDAALEIQHQMQARRDALLTDFQAEARAQNAALLTTPEGFRLVPAQDGQPLQPPEFAALPEEARQAWRETQHRLEHSLNEVMHRARGMENEARQELDQLVNRVASSVVDVAIADLRRRFEALAQLQPYIEALHRDILKNVDLFRQDLEEEDGNPGPPEASDERFRRYRVNVLVDHTDSIQAPVVVEYDPTVPRLLGRVEHEARFGGAVVTDFTLLRGGALHAANGGYLVLRARELFAEPGAWDALKRALVGNAVRPDDPAIRGGAATRSLDPEPIPLDIKVILIGPPLFYYRLMELDEDFGTLFKVLADFAAVVDRNPENEHSYARFVAALCRDESLPPFDREAVGRVIEYGSRLAGRQSKLSTRFGHIADLVREAGHWAADTGQALVTVAEVDRAIRHQTYLRNRVETQMREQLLQGKQLVAVQGETVGQINGLAVTRIGEHTFGHPSRLTARTYVGREGVIQIDRDADMAGPIHNKGLLTLVGYLGGQYAGDHPLSLSAQITFEQNYGGIDGDSASSTELYVLLSSLSGFPIRQSLAVTGSVNQHGEIQPIGGATEKVEGWYAVCQAQGLSGEQGVLIPAANVSDLMLRLEVVEAVAQGQFHIWPVRHIDEGITLLTGRPAKAVHAAVKARLRELAETLARYEARDWPRRHRRPAGQREDEADAP